MKVLINTPSLKLLGGVANHYLGLQNFWKENIRYNTVGKRSNLIGSGIFWLPFDIFKFVLKLLVFQPDVIVLNPSLGKNAIARDFIFLNVARILHKKVALFIHGFDFDFIKNTDKKWIVKNFNKASMIFVLAEAFKGKLQAIGVTPPIVLSTTKVDDKLLDSFSVKDVRNGVVNNILFLARIEENKGIGIVLKCFEILQEKYPHLKLTVVGDGSKLDSVRHYIETKSLKNIVLTGQLTGEAIAKAYINASIYILPTYHAEGMPTSVLEAMAFGLPVFTRKVGGLNDFFENGSMGYITESLDSKDFAKAILPYIEDAALTKKVSQYNASYAKEHFLASVVAAKMETYLKSII